MSRFALPIGVLTLSAAFGCAPGDPGDATGGGSSGNGGNGQAGGVAVSSSTTTEPLGSTTTLGTTLSTTTTTAAFVCDPPAAPGSFYELADASLDIDILDPVSMCQYRGDVVLVVNTAGA